jgi:hypothetical protein
VEIATLHAAGASQRAIAEACKKSKGWAQDRLAALGLAADRKAPKADTSIHPPTQNGDKPHDEAEEVSGEVLPPKPKPKGPVRYLPDEVAPDALQNLRTQAMRWFELGGRIDRMIEEGTVIDPQSREDKAAIKREAGEMSRIARRLKGAF